MSINISITVFHQNNIDYQKTLRRIKAFHSPLKFDFHVICNTYANEIFLKTNTSTRVIPAPKINREMEFSGYHDGVEAILDYFENAPGVDEGNYNLFFLNDTVFKHGALRKLEKLAYTEWKLNHKVSSSNLSSAWGFKHNSAYTKNIHKLQNGYINSKFFVLHNVKPEIVKKIFSLDVIKVTIDLNRENYINNIFEQNEYSVFLKQWLNGVGTKELKVWYKSSPLTTDNVSFYEKKARSIIHEHLLTVNLENSGVEICCIAKSSKVIKVLSFITGVKYQ